MAWPGPDDDNKPLSGPGGDQLGDRPTDPKALLPYVAGRWQPRLAEPQIEQALQLLSVPFESLPQPPFFAPLFGYTLAGRRRTIATRLVMISLKAKRGITPDEVNAVAYHQAMCMSRLPWAPATTLLAASYMTIRRRSAFRFPFYTPKPTWFDPWCFPTAGNAFLVGPSAVRLWHVLRFGAYGTLCHFTIGWFLKELISSDWVMETAADERLAVLNPQVHGEHVRKAKALLDYRAKLIARRDESFHQVRRGRQQQRPLGQQQEEEEKPENQQQQEGGKSSSRMRIRRRSSRAGNTGKSSDKRKAGRRSDP